MTLMETAQLLGSFGEFLGAIAVVVTLGYLAAQVRQNANSTESNAIAQAASDHLANMRMLAENPSLAVAFQKRESGEALDSLELTRLTAWYLCLLRGAETHVQVAKLGVVPEFEQPWEEILRGMSRDNEMARDLMSNYVGSKTFKSWLNERVLS